MDFYSRINEIGLTNLLERVDYEPPSYLYLEDVFRFFDDAIEEGETINIYGDYDVDGLMCILVVKRMLDLLEYSNYDVSPYRQRTHAFDTVAAFKCVQKGYRYMVVCDTGSSLEDKKVIKYLLDNGVRVLILDHHVSPFTYDDYKGNVTIINTDIENRLGTNEERLQLSAGALCYTVARAYLNRNGIEDDTISAYATISLFSDCMNMRSRLNRGIYFNSMRIGKTDLPRDVLYFMNEYSKFNARYINYWFSPRINAMFRSENLELLNLLFFSKELDIQAEQALTQRVEVIYENIRSMINEVTDIIANDVVELDNFVMVDLHLADEHVNVIENKLYNYTGLVANKLSERYGKTAIVYCLFNNVYKGSVRDLYSREYLPLFQAFCTAGGHGPAFGLKISAFDFNKFIDGVYLLNSKFAISGINNSPIIIDYDQNFPDPVLIEDIALYNEFAGQSVPIVLLRKQIIGAISEKHTKYGYKYFWGDYAIQSDHALTFGSQVLIKPFHSYTTKLLVQ